jgi:hypothetical protein
VASSAQHAGAQHARVDQPLQVVAEGRGGQVHVGLDVPRRGALAACLHHEAQDRKADGMAQCAELLSVTFDFRGHDIVLVFSNLSARYGSKIMERTVSRRQIQGRCWYAAALRGDRHIAGSATSEMEQSADGSRARRS